MIVGQGHNPKDSDCFLRLHLFKRLTLSIVFLLATSIINFRCRCYGFVVNIIISHALRQTSYLSYVESRIPGWIISSLGPCVQCGYREFLERMAFLLTVTK